MPITGGGVKVVVRKGTISAEAVSTDPAVKPGLPVSMLVMRHQITKSLAYIVFC